MLLRSSPKKPSGSTTRLWSTPAAHCRAWGDVARAMPVPMDSTAMNTAAAWATRGRFRRKSAQPRRRFSLRRSSVGAATFFSP